MSNAGDTPSEPGDTPPPEDLRQLLKRQAKRFAPGLVNSTDASDLAQQALIIAHNNGSKFRGEGTRNAWIIGILKILVRKWVKFSVKTQALFNRLPQSPDGESLVAESFDSTDASAVQGQVLTIRKIWRHLAAKDRNFLAATFLDPANDGLHSAELGTKIGRSADDIRQKKQRLVRHLQLAAQLVRTLEAYCAPEHYRQVLCWKRIGKRSFAVMARKRDCREAEVRRLLYQAEAWLAATGEIHDQSD